MLRLVKWIYMKRFYVKDIADPALELLREQNELLRQLLLAQQKANHILLEEVVKNKGSDPKALAAAEPFEVDDIYIPKLAKAESDISSIDTSKSKFNAGDVEKLKQAKAKA
mgnify:CR=1 FL=1